MGLESGFIVDGDLSATSSKTGHEPGKARLHGSSCWMPEHDDKSQYFTVFLGDKINLTAIATQGAAHETCWITAYTLDVLHTEWYTYQENDVVKVSLIWSHIDCVAGGFSRANALIGGLFLILLAAWPLSLDTPLLNQSTRGWNPVTTQAIVHK